MNENVTMMETLEWLIQDYDAGSSVALSVVSLRMIINEHAALKQELQELQISTYRFIHRPEIWAVRGTAQFKVDAGLMNDEIHLLAKEQDDA